MSVRPSGVVLGAIPALFLIGLPLTGLVSQLSWSRLDELVGDPMLAAALRTTLIVVPAATVVVVILGTPIAWLLARHDRPFGISPSVLRAFVLSPIVLPPVVSGVVLLSAFGRRGLLGSLLETFGVVLPFSLAGAVLAAVFVALPFHILATEEGFRSIPRSQLDAAQTLGVADRELYRMVGIRSARRAIAAGAALAAARALGEFGATITFAGNVEGATRTLPLATFTALEQDPDLARLIGVVLIVLAIVVAVGQRVATR